MLNQTFTELLPSLEQGERVGREEFEARYAAMRPGTKAELLEGIVYLMASPVSIDHSRPHAMLMTWLGCYWVATPGVDLHDNVTLLLDESNEVQPDALLRLEDQLGGGSKVSHWVEGQPELVVEVGASSAFHDWQVKRKVYEQRGIPEYLLWQTPIQRLHWFQLVNGKYQALPMDREGIIRSQVFPGLWLNGPALLAGKLQQVMLTLQQGLASPAYAAFGTNLKEKYG